MCNGPLLGKLLVFSVPLMLSGILQLLFNAADIIVVGRYTGTGAMAAVGSTSSLNNLIVNMFMGLSAGGSVVVAQYYGMRAWKDVGDTVHTAMLLGLVTGVAMLFAGMFLARPLLVLMGTTEDVIDQAVLYMRIVFAGMPALMVYDFGAGILRAIGDTRRPLFFLFCGGVINVGLNLFFVIVIQHGRGRRGHRHRDEPAHLRRAHRPLPDAQRHRLPAGAARAAHRPPQAGAHTALWACPQASRAWCSTSPTSSSRRR